MAEDLPAPKSRKEEYLATAAGMTGIELPEPASREEIYLDAIAQGGGGGGGSSYTAGDGIDITNNEISVDTETIQPKLTAGTNITIDQDNVISAEGGGPTVVQTIGTSTTDVMSQKAVTDTLFYNNDNNRIQIGYNTKAESSGTVAIGSSAQTQAGTGGAGAVAIGNLSKALRKESIAIGASATSNFNGSVALGSHSAATDVGVVAIGSSMSSYGYNSSNYRLLTGLYDPQNAHDAATKGYVDTKLGSLTLVSLTQSAYDALATKDPNTLYIITGA